MKTIYASQKLEMVRQVGLRLAVTAIALMFGARNAQAQTQVNLRTQSKAVDFSSAPSTKPMQSGTVLPSVCAIGQQFFNTAAPAGQNLYGCTALNVWTLQAGGSGGGGGGLPSQTGTAGYLSSNGSAASWGNIATGGSGALDCATVPGQCDIVTAIVPFKASANTWTGANDFSASPFLRVVNGAGIPASGGCTSTANVGKIYQRSDAAAANASLYVCSQTGAGVFAWELAQGGGPAITTNGQGYLWIPAPLTTDSLGTTFTALTPRFYQFVNPFSSMKITTLSAYVQGADAGKFMAMGVYDVSCNLMAQTNTLSLGTVGFMVWTFSPAITVGGGVYHLAIATDSTAAAVQSNLGTVSGDILNKGNPGTENRVFTGGAIAAASGSNLTLNSVCGTKTNSVALQVGVAALP